MSKREFKRCCLLLVGFNAVCLCLPRICTADAPTDLTVSSIRGGLTYPWGVVVLPDGRVLVSEKSGSILLVHTDGRGQKLDGIMPVFTLLDIDMDPRHDESGLICYSFVSERRQQYGIAVACAQLAEGELTNSKVVFQARPRLSSLANMGGRISFLPDATLLVSIGDQGNPNQAQSLQSHQGTIVRFAADGSIPKDNPFIDVDDALPEVFSYGHRNAQGLALDPESGAVYSTEHGPVGADEVNLIVAGKNYGWGLTDAVADASQDVARDRASVNPLITWSPAIAPSGVAVYSGSQFPDWRGDLLVATLLSKGILRIAVQDGVLAEQQVIAPSIDKRMRDVAVGPDGAIYALTDSAVGELLRISRSTETSEETAR